MVVRAGLPLSRIPRLRPCRRCAVTKAPRARGSGRVGAPAHDHPKALGLHGGREVRRPVRGQVRVVGAARGSGVIVALLLAGAAGWRQVSQTTEVK